jgi:hypothetical protein
VVDDFRLKAESWKAFDRELSAKLNEIQEIDLICRCLA